jgi:predicted permease
MPRLRAWFCRLLGLLQKKSSDAEIAEEIQQHLDLLTERNSAAGMSPNEARNAALRQFGGVEQIKETAREQRVWMWAYEFLQDLRFGCRVLRKTPGFTFIAILTLALGTGANSAIFSVIDAALLRPLPFPNSDELVALGGRDARNSNPGGRLGTISFPEFSDLRSRNSSFAQLAAYRDKDFAFSNGAETQNLRGQRVTGSFFSALGVEPVLGRGFRLEDEQAGGGPRGFSVILSNDFWRRQFSGDRNVLGRQLALDGQSFTIIGVLPAGFRYPIQTESIDIYVTVAVDAAPVGRHPPVTEQRDNRFLRCVGRLRPNVSIEQASAEIHALARALKKENPATNSDWDVIVRTLRDELVANVRVALWILSGAVVCVLLIASVNVANLLLYRASSRAREIAVRIALGAGRARIFRQLLSESVLLAVIGGALGLVIALWGTHSLIALAPQQIPRTENIQIDPPVFIFALGISLITGIIFGLAPALQATRVDLNQALKATASGSIGRGQRVRAGRLLVIVQIALALILLASAGLLLQSFNRLSKVRPGLQTERLLTGRVTLPPIGYPNPEKIAAFYEQLVARLRILPGVRAASTVLPLPLSGSISTTQFDLPEHPLPQSEQPLSTTRLVGFDYFQTVGIPVLRGRSFTETDRLDSKPVAIVNESFAQKYFQGQDPVGKQMKSVWSVTDQPPQMREIVGVVGDAKGFSLRDDFEPEVYLPIAQVPWPVATIVLNTESSNPTTITKRLRAELHQIDPNLPFTDIRVFDEYRSRSLDGARFNALLLSIFAGVALILTAVGLYGVIAYSVSQHTSEIGIRMALGALPPSIARLVVGENMTLVLIGIGIGLPGALACARLMKSLLFGVTASDPVTFVSIGIVIATVALLACWLPARRAARVNPSEALRME